MRHDELAHYGVRGMRWRNKKASIIDPSNTSIRVKKPDGTARVEKEKNLSLSGTGNKRFSSTERELDDKKEKDELNKKVEEAAKKDQEDREAREAAAKQAYEDSLAKARERVEETTPKKEVQPVKKETKAETKTVDQNKFKLSNQKDRAYTYFATQFNKTAGIKQTNVMNDVSKNNPLLAEAIKAKNKKKS